MSETNAVLREVAYLYDQAQRTTAACCDVQSQTHGRVLTELARAQPLTPHELSLRLGYEKSWISRVVGALLNENLVEKMPHPSDNRSHQLSLTSDGEIRVMQLDAVLNAHTELLMEAVPDEKRQSVEEALVLLRDALLAEKDSIPKLAELCEV